MDDAVFQHPEEGYRMLLTHMLSTAHRECCWICKASQNPVRCMSAREGVFADRLANAAVAWAWVMGLDTGTVSFREACDELNLCPLAVRRKILSHCKPSPDINTVARHAIDVFVFGQDPSQLQDKPGLFGQVYWCPLECQT